VKEGICMMHRFQRERQLEKVKIKDDLEAARKDLPSCIVLLRSLFEAINVASSLNTTVQGAATGPADANKDLLPVVSTPAEEVRRMYRRSGWNSLSVEEQQWCVMDQVMHPGKYEWLREQQDEENQARILRGLKPKKIKLSAAIQPFILTKVELEHIMLQPYAMLTKQEMIIRKLIVKYHDDQEILKRKVAAVASGYDPHLAERTRSKDQRAFSREEHEWSTIDRILHPEVWKYYSNYDAARDKSTSIQSQAPLQDRKQQGAMDALGRILQMNPNEGMGQNILELADNAHLNLVKKATKGSPWLE